jgi:hypothetical protein
MLSDRHADLSRSRMQTTSWQRKRGWPAREGVLLMSNRLTRSGQNAVYTQVIAGSVVAW